MCPHGDPARLGLLAPLIDDALDRGGQVSLLLLEEQSAQVDIAALRDGLPRAQAIRSFLAGSDSYVGILGCDARSPVDPAQLALPFLLDTTEVHVVGAADLIGCRG